MTQDRVDNAEATMVSLRLLNRSPSSRSPETINAVLRSHTRRGLVVALASPFIDNQHIMMSMPDGSSCRLGVLFPETDKPLQTAEVLRFNKEKEEDSERAWFVVELAYVSTPVAEKPSKIWAPFRRKAGQIIRGGEDLD